MMRRNGFTLIEMLVGLSIFALLASAGVGLLRASADTQSTVEVALSEQARLERIALLLQADLGQIAMRPTRTLEGVERPAFSGDAKAMEFVRGGVVSLDERPSSDLRRIGWRGDTGRLERLTFEAVDGNDDALAPAVLVDPLRSVAFAYRDRSGGWVERWPDASGDALPRAVRLTFSAPRTAPTDVVVALPTLHVPSDER